MTNMEIYVMHYYIKSLEYYNNALHIFPYWSYCMYYKSDLLYKLNKFKKSLQVLNHAYKINNRIYILKINYKSFKERLERIIKLNQKQNNNTNIENTKFTDLIHINDNNNDKGYTINYTTKGDNIPIIPIKNPNIGEKLFKECLELYKMNKYELKDQYKVILSKLNRCYELFYFNNGLIHYFIGCIEEKLNEYKKI